MYNQEPGDRYKMDELHFTRVDGQEVVTLLCVSYENGVRITVSDLQNVFENGFSEYLTQYHEENEKEYLYENTMDPAFEIVPVAILIDAAYSLGETDKVTLFNWLDAIERRLVRVW